MSTHYKHFDTVPSAVLAKRLDELADATTLAPEAMGREFTRRIPAELDRDADLVLSQAAKRLRDLEAERDALAAHAEAVAGAVGLPENNINRRRTSVIVTCVTNMQRFADYLHAVEREFLMVPGEADDDFPDQEPEDECLVNSWGARSREHYVEQFRRALARHDAEKQAEALERKAKEFRRWANEQEGLDENRPPGAHLDFRSSYRELEREAKSLRRQAEGGDA